MAYFAAASSFIPSITQNGALLLRPDPRLSFLIFPESLINAFSALI